MSNKPSEYQASQAPSHSDSQNLKIQLEYFAKFAYAYVVGLFLCFVQLLTDRQKPKDITGQVALVTGGGNGLGRELCLRLAREDCHVAVVDWDLEAAQKTAEDAQKFGVKSFAYKVDVSNYDKIKEAREKIIKELGSVDIVINNAALMPLLSVHEGCTEDVQTVLNVNIGGSIWTTRVFMPDMIKNKRGHIVGVSSMYGIHPAGRNVLYGTTKHAVRGFMDSLEEEIYFDGMQDFIKTTTVFPFFINTRQYIRDSLQQMGLESRMIIISPQYAADVIVKAILNNERKLSVPKGFLTSIQMTLLLPRIVYDCMRNFIIGTKHLPPIPPRAEDSTKSQALNGLKY